MCWKILTRPIIITDTIVTNNENDLWVCVCVLKIGSWNEDTFKYIEFIYLIPTRLWWLSILLRQV